MSLADTQSHVPIASLEEGVVILKDGSLAVVLRIYPINFDLKNESEQNTIINRYQQFLNSLDHPIQILVRSRQLDLRPYLADLGRRTGKLDNELLKRQAEDYIKFMQGLVDVANSNNQRLMTKQYYVVLQYQRATVTGGTTLPFGHKADNVTLTRGEFERIRTELNNRANNVAGMLLQLGLRIEALDTQHLIELFYSIYNPDIANAEQLTNVEDLNAGVVQVEGGLPPTPVAASAPAPLNTPATPGLTGSGDAISISAAGSSNIAANAPVADVPEEAKKAAQLDASKLPHAAPASAPAEAPAPPPATAPETPAPTPPTEEQSVNLNIPPAA
jgi:hypothetical protein